MRARPSAVVAALLVVSGLAWGGLARAEERDPREAEAKKACLGGKAERGIELLAELYAETNDATYIYNQGRCFEQNGRASDAITRFREYLRKAPNMPADERALVQAHITEMEAQARPASTPAAPAASVTAPAATLTTPPPAAAPDNTRALRTAALVSASVGVALVGAGVYFGLRAESLGDEVTADAKKGRFTQSKYDEGQRDELLQWIGYGVGAAAIVSGGVLYFLGARGGGADADGATVTALPTLGPAGPGAALRVTF